MHFFFTCILQSIGLGRYNMRINIFSYTHAGYNCYFIHMEEDTTGMCLFYQLINTETKTYGASELISYN